MTYRKKLIEVALPLEAINRASIREGYIYRGNPSSLHKWWAQRPLAAARAVLFAQLVDDPSAVPEEYTNEAIQERERRRLFRIIEDLVIWENQNNNEVLLRAQAEIARSAARALNVKPPESISDIRKFLGEIAPPLFDPFCGGGTIALEAQRLGLRAYASDLNPVAVLITKALIEIPPSLAGRPPINPLSRVRHAGMSWRGTRGLAEDISYYGEWIYTEAVKRIGHLYPKIGVTPEIAREHPGLRQFVGKELAVITWLWARTVRSPNPAYSNVDVPLATTFMLSTKPGKEAYVEPVLANGTYSFIVRRGVPENPGAVASGTKLKGANFRCVMSCVPISDEYIKSEATAGRMGMKIMAAVVACNRRRVYVSPTPEMEEAATLAAPRWLPENELSGKCRDQAPLYGMNSFASLYTSRQLVAMTTFVDLVSEAHERILSDMCVASREGLLSVQTASSVNSEAYANAIAIYLACSVDKVAEYGCTAVPWYTKEDRPKGLFARQAVPMVWDFAEVNPLGDIGGTLKASVRIVTQALKSCPSEGPVAVVMQHDAVKPVGIRGMVVSTDPPYYANIAYADLSDFFYVWLRHSVGNILPSLFETLSTPKADELVATPYYHISGASAETRWLDGMTQVMRCLLESTHAAIPVTLYYAYKQREVGGKRGEAGSSGWDTFLEAIVRAGFAISGTWPIRTERGKRSVGIGSNVLASSIVLVCRPRATDAGSSTRREFTALLRKEFPGALAKLRQGNIAPVDLAQAAIGPGMAVFSRYSKVIEADGGAMSVRTALQIINQELDAYLADQEGEFDPVTRWALAWFEQHGTEEGPFGSAESLSKAKNTAVNALEAAGVVVARAGHVRLVGRGEMPDGWDLVRDRFLTVWECVQHLVRALEQGGEQAAAKLVARLGEGKSEEARALAYRLYSICERKRWAQEAQAYNGLVIVWPEILKQTGEYSGLFRKE